MKRINEKIIELEQFLEELKSIAPLSIEEYTTNIEKKAACERYIEKIVETITDLAFMVIKVKKLKIPEDDVDAFSILLENKIIDETLSKKLKNAKGMRNIIAHQYGKIDDNIVFESITKEINTDSDEFIKKVKKCQ